MAFTAQATKQAAGFLAQSWLTYKLRYFAPGAPRGYQQPSWPIILNALFLSAFFCLSTGSPLLARHHLIYMSWATRPFTTAALASLLREPRVSGVTGLLVYHEGRFVQVLEGEAAVVA